MVQHALKEKISTRDAVIGIIGLGYVGLPLAQQASLIVDMRNAIQQKLPHIIT